MLADAAVLIERALRSSRRMPPRELAHELGTGVYAWWDENAALERHWPAGFPAVDSAEPLYIGQARGSFAQRAIAMHLKATRVSSIRRSLAALLADELDLLPGAVAFPSGKMTLAPPAEQRLSDWMLEHLTVSVAEHAAPGRVEGAIIATATPPLNDTYATHGPFQRHMRAARAALHARIAAL